MQKWSDGRFHLEVDPTWLADHGYVVFRTHPSWVGQIIPEVTLHESKVPAELVGMAPGQSWPMGFHRRKVVRLPLEGLEPEGYEAAIGLPLAVHVLEAHMFALRGEYTGKSQEGMVWRDPRPAALLEWERVQDLVLLGWERLKMQKGAERG